MGESRTSWQMEGWGAHLNCGPLGAFAGSDADGSELLVQSWDGRPAPGFAVLCSGGPEQRSEPLSVIERYVRENDFVESCKPLSPYCITPQIYWRASFVKPHRAARIEVILSAQTDLLDSAPRWNVTSMVRDAKRLYASDLAHPNFEDISYAEKQVDVAVSTAHLFLFRVEALALSYAQMVHPSDFVSAHAPFDGNQPQIVESILFPERLEKGVIRRGRICGWFMPAENDLETAVALARQFIDEPLPLTT